MPTCPNCGQYYVRAPCPSCGYMGDSSPAVPAPPVIEKEKHSSEEEEHVLKPSQYIQQKETGVTETRTTNIKTSASMGKTMEASLESLKGYMKKTSNDLKSESSPQGVDVPYRKRVMEKLLEIRNIIDEILEM